MRHRSLQSTCRGITYPDSWSTQETLELCDILMLLGDQRCLPIFLPRMTWERMMRLSELIPLELWSMNCSAIATVMVSCDSRYSRSRPGHSAGLLFRSGSTENTALLVDNDGTGGLLALAVT